MKLSNNILLLTVGDVREILVQLKSYFYYVWRNVHDYKQLRIIMDFINATIANIYWKS